MPRRRLGDAPRAGVGEAVLDGVQPARDFHRGAAQYAKRPASSVADMTRSFTLVVGSVFVLRATSKKSVSTSRSWASSTTTCVTSARPSGRWSRLNNTPTVTNSSRVAADVRRSKRTL